MAAATASSSSAASSSSSALPPALVAPGDVLAPAASYEAGTGAYIAGESVLASLAGLRQVAPAGSGGKPTVHVMRPGSSAAIVPAVGSRVLGRVTRITAMAATVELLLVDGQPVAEPFHATVRKENVRDKEIDRVKMEEAFRPGDVIKAEVLAMGTQRMYVLSTAAIDLGVVAARSETTGDLMVPVGWEEMEVPGGGAALREKRKVARPEV